MIRIVYVHRNDLVSFYNTILGESEVNALPVVKKKMKIMGELHQFRKQITGRTFYFTM